MPTLEIYSWSQFTSTGGLSPGDLTGNTHPNDPDAPIYSSSAASWIGKVFIYNGWGPTQIDINDDDGDFEDGYVETGTAQTLAQSVTIDGVFYPAGSTVENEFSLVHSTGKEVHVVRIDGQNVGFRYAEGEEPTGGETFIPAQGVDGAASDNADGVSSSTVPYSDVLCFAEGTLIETKDGPRPVEDLHPGDLVRTLDHGPKAILWRRTYRQSLDGEPDEGRPVLISAGALGPGCPRADLIVSPWHRILVGGGQLDEIFANKALAPAKSLTRLPGIRHMRGKRHITWVHFAFATHEVVFSNDCLTESLLLGPMATNGMTCEARREIAHLFGRAPSGSEPLNGPPARHLLTVQATRKALEAGKRRLPQPGRLQHLKRPTRMERKEEDGTTRLLATPAKPQHMDVRWRNP